MAKEGTRWTPGKKAAWTEAHFADDAPENEPTHIVNWRPIWRFGLLVPPWCDPEELQAQLVTALNDLTLDYDVAEAMGRDFEGYVLTGQNEGSSSSLEEA